MPYRPFNASSTAARLDKRLELRSTVVLNAADRSPCLCDHATRVKLPMDPAIFHMVWKGWDRWQDQDSALLLGASTPRDTDWSTSALVAQLTGRLSPP